MSQNCPSYHRYEATTEDVGKWGALVKRNREAPTLDLTAASKGPQRATTIAALNAGFKAQSAMERDIEAMLQAAGAGSSRAIEEAEEALALKVCGGRAKAQLI